MFSKLQTQFLSIAERRPTNKPRISANTTFDEVPVGAICIERSNAHEFFEKVLQNNSSVEEVCIDFTFDPRREYICIYSLCLSLFMHPDMPTLYSDVAILKLLNTKVKGYRTVLVGETQIHRALPFPVQDDLVMSSFDLHSLILSSRSLGFVLYDNQVSQICLYQKIVAVLTKLNRKEQLLLSQIVEDRIGPIDVLASELSISNLNEIMSKLKLSISLPLLFKFATSPSIVGKITAIWQLLELHGLLWLTISTEKVSQFLTIIYHCFTFLMTKTRLLYDLLKEKIEFVAAKVFKSEGETCPVQIEMEQFPINRDVERMEQAEQLPVLQTKVGDVGSTFGLTADEKLIVEQFQDDKDLAHAINELEFKRWYDSLPDDDIRKTNMKLYNRKIDFTELKVAASKVHFRKQCAYCGVPSDIGCTDCKIHVCNYCSRGGAWCSCENFNVHTTNVCTCTIQQVRKDGIYPSTSFYQGGALSQVETGSVSESSQKSSSADEMFESIMAHQIVEIPCFVNVEQEATVEVASVKEFIESVGSCETGKCTLTWLESIVVDLVGFFESHPMLGGLTTLAVTLASFFGCSIPLLCGPSESSQFIKKLSEGLRCAFYAQKGTEGILGAVGGLFEILKTILGISSDSQIVEFKKKVVDLSIQCRKMLDLAISNPGAFMNSAQDFGYFKKKVESIHDIYRTLATGPSSSNMQVITPIWQNLHKTFNELSEIFHKMTSSVSDRQVPVLVWIWGRSDLGKSKFLSCLADYLNKQMKRHMQVHTLSKGPEYWNNYCQQDIIKIDDFASWIGPDGNVDALAVFNLVTNAAYNPNMANLSDKHIMATPKFVFIAANDPTIPLNTGVTNIEAFERRRHIFLQVSWPEHERHCQPGVKHCDHWKPVLEKFNKEKVYDFGHLTFNLCDPIVTVKTKDVVQTKSKDKTRSKEQFVFAQQTTDQIIADGRQVTTDEIVQFCIKLENKHALEYQIALQQKISAGSVLQSVTVDWTVRPTLLLAGPPGTGKTTIIDRYIDKYSNVKYKHIKTLDDFDKFAKNSFSTHTVLTCVFHDLSAFLLSEHFSSFLTILRARLDEKVHSINPWILIGNLDLLEQKMNSIHGSLEGAAYYCRGLEIIEFSFKKYFSLAKLGRSLYTAADVREKPVNIDQMVSRVYDFKEYSREQLIVLINNLQPKTHEVRLKDNLVSYQDFEPDTTVRVAMFSHEFLEFCSGANPMIIADHLVRGGVTEFASKKFSFVQMATRLYNAVRRSKASAGTVIDLEALLLEAWNLGHLEEFKGDKILFSFLDVQYVIETVSNQIVLGVINNPIENCTLAKQALKSTIRTIDEIDFVEFGSTKILPWICFSANAILSIAKVLVTGLVTYNAIDQEHKAQKAISAYDATAKVTEEHVATTIGAISKDMQTKLYPGLHNGVRTPQHATIEEEDPRCETGDAARVPRKRQTGDSARATPTPRSYRRQHAEPIVSDQHPMPVSTCITQQYNSAMPFEVSKEISSDPTLPAIMNKVLANCVEIRDQQDNRLCFGLMVKGRIGTTVSHVTEVCKVSELYAVCANGAKYKIKKTLVQDNIDRLDFEIIDQKVPEFPDITNHFCSRAAPPNYHCGGVLLNLSFDVNSKFPIAKLRSYTIQGMSYVKFTTDPTQYYHIKYVGHKAGVSMSGIMTYAGDCGSILLISDPYWEHGKIVGMHVGAGTNVAYARIISSQQYETTQQKQCLVPSHKLDPDYCKPVEHENKQILGYSNKKQFVPIKTKLYRNVEPIGPKVFEPAILTDRDTRNPGIRPLELESMKWLEKPVEIPSKYRDWLEKIATDTADYFADILAREGVQLSTLTRMEAINKLSGCSKSEPINVKTSSGFPFCDETRQPGKRSYLKVDDNGIHRFIKDTDRSRLLKKGMDRYLNEAHGRGQASTIFKIFLKDEPVKLKKIYETPSTRTIAMAPLDYQIVFRQYLHSGMAFMNENWHLLPPKIGIVPQSNDWNTLFSILASKNMTAVDIDYSGWDFSQHPFFIQVLAIFWNRLYFRLDPKWEKFHDEIRNVLYSKLINFLMLVGNTIFKSSKGIPSGYPGTANDNSLINLFLQILVYFIFMEQSNPKLLTVACFFEDVAIVDYGDDLLMTFSEYYMRIVDLKQYTQILKDLGFNATSADKTGQMEFKNLMDCQFMSRSFKLSHGLIMGPLLLERLFKTSWWVHGKQQHLYYLEPELEANDPEIIASAYLSMLHEAVLHGHELFEIVRSAALKAKDKIGHGDLIPTYQDLLTNIFGIVLNRSKFFDVQIYDETQFILDKKIKFSMQLGHKFHNRTSLHFGPQYVYNGVVHPEKLLTQPLKEILVYFNDKYNRKWNSILVNEYPPGGSIPWHKDNEDCLDQDQGVGCLTLIGDGQMQFQNQSDFFRFNVSSGDFYIIGNQNAKLYQHRRIGHCVTTVSLTFRTLTSLT